MWTPRSGTTPGRQEAGPTEQITPLPESAYAREIFSTLGGIVEIGAVVAAGTWAVADASVGGLVSARQDEVDRLLGVVRELGGFSDASMAIVDELGYLRQHQVTAPSLLLWCGYIEEITWSGSIEEPSPRLEELERPSAVRRMCHIGADLQLANFLQALVTAAIAGGRKRDGARRAWPRLSPSRSLWWTMRDEAAPPARSGPGGSPSSRAFSAPTPPLRTTAGQASALTPTPWRYCSRDQR
ncbi:hypothetical protein [Streptomyces sp. NPDC050564]|uniref:hypothetical protein n=1 Tax=Streptomyces sp. NPDC050564 TaxID=3365631 RepID=UPI00379E7F17